MIELNVSKPNYSVSEEPLTSGPFLASFAAARTTDAVR
jgi:hypothetical protein